ncbi:MAG: hypothetical protein ACLFQK_08535 [Fibrobacterota bacterium]
MKTHLFSLHFFCLLLFLHTVSSSRTTLNNRCVSDYIFTVLKCSGENPEEKICLEVRNSEGGRYIDAAEINPDGRPLPDASEIQEADIHFRIYNSFSMFIFIHLRYKTDSSPIEKEFIDIFRFEKGRLSEILSLDLNGAEFSKLKKDTAKITGLAEIHSLRELEKTGINPDEFLIPVEIKIFDYNISITDLLPGKEKDRLMRIFSKAEKGLNGSGIHQRKLIEAKNRLMNLLGNK